MAKIKFENGSEIEFYEISLMPDGSYEPGFTYKKPNKMKSSTNPSGSTDIGPVSGIPNVFLKGGNTKKIRVGTKTKTSKMPKGTGKKKK